MSNVLPSTSGESLWFDDSGALRQVPIVGWRLTEDVPMPITALGTFYPGKRYGVHYEAFFVVMPDRIVTRSHEQMKHLVLGQVYA